MSHRLCTPVTHASAMQLLYQTNIICLLHCCLLLPVATKPASASEQASALVQGAQAAQAILQVLQMGAEWTKYCSWALHLCILQLICR